MTDARLGGLGREALVSNVGEARLGGLAREALISGTGLAGRSQARSAGRAAPTVLTSGIALSATAGARSSGRAFVLPIVTLGGRVSAGSQARLAQLPDYLPLAGRIGAQARGALTERGVRVLQARSFAASRARGSLSFRLQGPQNAVTLNV
jgi:hypothetical protein